MEMPLDVAVTSWASSDGLQWWFGLFVGCLHFTPLSPSPSTGIRKIPDSAVLFSGSRTVGQITLIPYKHVIVA